MIITKIFNNNAIIAKDQKEMNLLLWVVVLHSKRMQANK